MDKSSVRCTSSSSDTAEYALWPRSEFEWRWGRLRQLMREEGFDALLVSNYDNWHWITGAEPPVAWHRRFVAVMPRDGKPIAIVRAHFCEKIKRSTYLDDIRGHTEGPVPFTVQVLKELGVENGTVGAEIEAPYQMGIMYDEFESIRKQLPSVRFRSLSQVLIKARLVKSQLTIEACRKACQATDAAHIAVPQLVRRGMLQRELAERLTRVMQEEGGYAPFVYVRDGTDNIGAIGTYRAYQSINANRPLKDGYLLVDMGCSYKYYNSDFSHHYWIGQPPPAALRYAKISLKALDRTLEMIRAGVSSADIISATFAELRNQGISQIETTDRGPFFGGIGHAIGTELIDGINLGSDTVLTLEEGMVFAIEPAFMTDMGQWIPEVNLAVTKNGYDLLSSYPVDLQVIP